MSEINTRVCTPYATVQDLELSPAFNTTDKIEPGILEDSLTMATDALFELSGHKEPGLCSRTVRPANRNSYNFLLGYGWSSNYQQPADWQYGWGWCNCGAVEYGACSCEGVDTLNLGAFPLVSIQSVKVNGTVLPASSYRIDDFKYLVRTDGQTWPSSQDLSKDSTHNNTFEVTFTYGHSISAGAKRAAIILAIELSKAFANDKTCKLPERVQTVSRQGVTVAFIDVMAFFKEHRTGLYQVDLWLTSVNPDNNKSSAVVMSPDVGPSAGQIGT